MWDGLVCLALAGIWLNFHLQPFQERRSTFWCVVAKVEGGDEVEDACDVRIVWMWWRVGRWCADSVAASWNPSKCRPRYVPGHSTQLEAIKFLIFEPVHLPNAADLGHSTQLETVCHLWTSSVDDLGHSTQSCLSQCSSDLCSSWNQSSAPTI